MLVLLSGARFVEIPVNYLPRVGKSSVTGDPLKAFVLGLKMIALVLAFRVKAPGDFRAPRHWTSRPRRSGGSDDPGAALRRGGRGLRREPAGACHRPLPRQAHKVRRRACPPPARLLDVGCGTGALAAKLAARGYEATGLDPSDGMLGVLRERDPRSRRSRHPRPTCRLPTGSSTSASASRQCTTSPTPTRSGAPWWRWSGSYALAAR